MGRTGFRPMRVHDRRFRTNIRVGSEELEAMAALEYIYELCERPGPRSEGEVGMEGKKTPKSDCFILCSKLIKSVPSGK